MTYKKRDHPKNQGGLFFGIAFERYFYSESAVGKIAVHATPIWWSRGESIQSRVRSDEPLRAALFMRGVVNCFASTGDRLHLQNNGISHGLKSVHRNFTNVVFRVIPLCFAGVFPVFSMIW